MPTGGTSPTRRRPGSVAGRGRSLRPPTPPAAQESSTSAEDSPARSLSRSGRILHWSGWAKLGAALTTIATLAVAGGTVGALYFTNQSLRATNNQYGLSQQTAATDRFRLAAEQLASDKVNVRLSGIYLLERLARDSPADHATVFAVIAAFVRTQAAANDCATWSAAAPVDIQAALTVIGRREITLEQPTDRPDLSRTCLTTADLVGAKLANVKLDYAKLAQASLTDADLSDASLARTSLAHAKLIRTKLIGANLVNADLAGAGMLGADLSKAALVWANLAGAIFWGASLAEANLQSANLTGADFKDANLRGADLSGANLTGADLSKADLSGANLTEANLTGIVYDNRTRWPIGFTPSP
ncbi:pentapeptide repeat-containing protein [Nocardia noduli]|uniref:pentapeptide repeat-containing protein n=1 Tax=Nocardia noduli TaxID=2815722 RepID=UPI001C238F50|nr:pentapeptide repeat-containing protein [Nocardia noduli]